MFEDTIYNFRKELQTLGYSKTSVENYPRAVQLFLLHTHEIPQKITAEHIKNYHDYLQQRPKKAGKGKLSPFTIIGQLAALKVYFNYLQRTNQIRKNPFNLKLKKPARIPRTPLTPQEIQNLYKHCQTRQEKLILHLGYGCGLRISEIQNLNLGDIDLKKKLLYIRQGKGKKRRVIPITQKVFKDFKKHLKFRKKNSLGRVGEDLEAFLINSQTNRLLINRIDYIFKRILKRASMPKTISMHHLRHSIATHLLENNMGIEMIRNFLGHSQLDSTQIYTRVNLAK